MTNVTIRNDFHATDTTIRCEVLSHIYNVNTVQPNVRQIKRAKHALCGIAGCTCSNDIGARGPQTHNGKRLEINLDAIFCYQGLTK